jgi:1D-myo-inositol 3-kinase
MQAALVVGHYCHDTLYHAHGGTSATLGGSASYISTVLSALGVGCQVVSKVGADFKYHSQIPYPAEEVSLFQTTQFIADFRSGERVGRVDVLCESIFPENIPSDLTFELGLAVGIVGEVLPETLDAIADRSRFVLCDVQGMIRKIQDGRVGFQRLEETEYFPRLGKITYLKANRQESEWMNLEEVRKHTCVLVTEGKDGCTVYLPDREFRVPAFPATEVDPTGAGDCFLAGFAAGLLRGHSLEKAVLLGNYCGALAVQQVGIPSANCWQFGERLVFTN